MKVDLKNILIFGLVSVFFVSAIMCCCFTDTVQAEELTPSCHQTEQETESSQNTEECGCDQSMAIVKKDVALKDSVIAVTILIFDQKPENRLSYSSRVVAYQAPLQFYDTSQLYLKHTVLRI